jgi:hypothetical protein
MPSPPDTNREYAYFRAVGIFDPADITKAIGLEPTECWSLGDEFVRRGHTLTRRGSCWKLDSGLDDTNPLGQHVDALLRKLTPRRAGVLEAAPMAKLQIVCVGYYYQSFSWELDFHHQQLATALNIGFWFDTYSFGDYHEEMVELREQVGVRQ